MGTELPRDWRVTHPGPLHTRPLRPVRESPPRPAADELLVRVLACGVCRTDLHVAEGDLPVHRPGVIPGHEVIGEVIGSGAAGLGEFEMGQRVGIAWLRRTCGHCRYCTRGHENLCPRSGYTGWDADGGYADYTTVPADYAYPLPGGYSDAELAPLLCAGIIGWRALARANLPSHGRLALYGFGASAHLTAQIALARGATVHVFTRSPRPENSPWHWAPPRSAGPPTHPRNRSIPRSSSPPPENSCHPRWPHSIGAAPWH
jgi:alcohol dehydrogenase, propanol-preferring